MIDPVGFGVFGIVFAVVAAIIVVGFVVVIVLVIRNVRKARQSGADPTTLQTDLAVRLLQSDALRAESTPQQRLEALDALRADGSISEEEYRQTRERILREF